ncbi:hypothetical protein L6232_23940, partial [Shewanella sp. C31]|nr:hypothetical protein [Shewanella electrica]
MSVRDRRKHKIRELPGTLREALEAWLLDALRAGLTPPGLEGGDPVRARFFALAGEMWRLVKGVPAEEPR